MCCLENPQVLSQASHVGGKYAHITSSSHTHPHTHTVAATRPSTTYDPHAIQVRSYLDTYLESTEFFGCWKKFYPATSRNYWGGLESDPVTLYANGVAGREDWMYMVIVVPEVDDAVRNCPDAFLYGRDLAPKIPRCKNRSESLNDHNRVSINGRPVVKLTRTMLSTSQTRPLRYRGKHTISRCAGVLAEIGPGNVWQPQSTIPRVG